MEKQILEHADALYIRDLQEIAAKQVEELGRVHRDARKRGLSSSGIHLSNDFEVRVASIGQRMKARIMSFRQAFEAANVEPSLEEFEQIWRTTEEVFSQLINTMSAELRLRATQMGNPNQDLPHVQPAAAHFHDEVLAEFNVWRSRVGLAGVRKSFTAENVSPLNELKHQEDCLFDLQSLLGVERSLTAVLYMDLDNFKAVNDAGQHEAGDKCIAQAARIIGSVVQHKGRLYRLHEHGDEFAVVLPNCDASEARATAERIRAEIEQQQPGGEILVTVSIGGIVATGELTAGEVLKRADKAMYQAKEAKNTVCFA